MGGISPESGSSANTKGSPASSEFEGINSSETEPSQQHSKNCTSWWDFFPYKWDWDEPPQRPGRQDWAGEELHKALGWDSARNLSPAIFTLIKREIIP